MEIPNSDPQPADSQLPDSPVPNFNYQMWFILLICTAISLLLALLYRNGLFDQWQQFPTPPVKPVKFQGVNRYFYQADPFILAEDGKTYTCVNKYPAVNHSAAPCTWEIGEPEDKNPLSPCRQGGIKFSAMKKTYNGLVDCFETEMYGEFIGAPEVTYIIDSEGIVWRWAEENKGNAFVFIGGGIFLGLLAGYIISLPGIYLMTRLEKPQEQQIQALVDWEIRKLRWGARISSLASLLYFSFQIFINRRSIPPENLVEFILIFSLAAAWVGLILAWRWEILGGTIILVALFTGLLRLSNSSGSITSDDVIGSILIILPYLPGALFLASGIWSRRQKKIAAQGSE